MFALHIEPGVILSWDQFRRQKPAYSIALDGFVAGPPSCDMRGPWVNLNHHEGVNRLATRATCEQVLVSINMGLLESFMVDGKRHGHLYVNDIDEDVCLSTWIFRNYRLLGSSRAEEIHRLVYIEGLMDTTAGAYPLPLDAPELQELAWVFQPFHQACRAQDPTGLDLAAREAVVDEVGRHISKYVRGKSERIELDGRYEVLLEGSGYAMVREQGMHARTAMRAHGMRAFISCRPREEKGRYNYTVARMSPYISFPVLEIFEWLNQAEGIGPDDRDRWDGSDTVGGSPRVAGSTLDPQAVLAVVEAGLKARGEGAF